MWHLYAFTPSLSRQGYRAARQGCTPLTGGARPWCVRCAALCAEQVAETPENTLKLVAAALCWLGTGSATSALENATRAMSAHCPPPVSYVQDMQRRLAGRGMIPKAGGSGAGAAQQARVVRGGAAMEALLEGAGCGGAVSAAGLQRIILIVQVWAGTEMLHACSAQPDFRVGGRGHAALQPAVQAVLRTCQLLLDVDPGCSFAYQQAAGVISYLLDPYTTQRLPHAMALLEHGIAVAKEAHCE